MYPDKEVRKVEIGKRKLRILSVIVETYVETGEPVGSKTVCNLLDFPISSATVRNEMSELVELGLLEQPHTSAGRIPSQLGYRVYLNHLEQSRQISEYEKNLINDVLWDSADDPEHLIEAAAKVLAKITNFTSIITTPPEDEARVRDVQFVQTGRRSAMIVLMTSTGMVKNRLFRCNYDISPVLLKIFREVLNEKLSDKLLTSLKSELMNMVVQTDSEIALLMSPVIKAVMETAREACQVNIRMGGRNNLLILPDFKAENIVNILDFLDSKENILKLLLEKERGVNIFIGEETNCLALENSSIVVTRYSIGGRSGAIGVIGPTRMDYSGLITKVEYVAYMVEKLLNKILDI